MCNRTLRLINFLVDTGIYFVLMFVLLGAMRTQLEKENIKWISLICYFLYYFLFEYFTGQTIGKIITKSKVILVDGEQNRLFIRILGRTLIRFIPLDILSYLFTINGFHDRISKTSTVKT